MNRLVSALRFGLMGLCVSLLLVPSPTVLSEVPQKKLLLGLIPEMNIFKQKKRFKPLGDYLSKKTGLPVEFTILSRYGSIIESFRTEKRREKRSSSSSGRSSSSRRPSRTISRSSTWPAMRVLISLPITIGTNDRVRELRRTSAA